MILKELRKKAKLTQEKLATKVGVSRSKIAMYESGASQPDLQMITKLAEAFKLTPDSLFKFSHIETKESLINHINRKLITSDLEKVKLISKIIDEVII